MNATLMALVATSGTICGIIFGYVGYLKGLRKEFKSEGKEDGELKANTEYIRRRVDDVLLEQRDLNKTMNNHAERLTRVEESVKQAHKRIDRIERNDDE